MLPRHRVPAHHHDGPRGLSVLGSTGSIGTQALDVAARHPGRLRVVALAAGRNWALLAEQARAHRPEVVAVGDEACYGPLRDALAGTETRVVAGPEGLEEAATLAGADLVLGAIVGFAGLRPTVAAIRAGKPVALANKETLVVAGALVQRLVRAHESHVVPVDSEHAALFQCLVGEPEGSVERLTLTASGGPFRQLPLGAFGAVTPERALRHPNWSMGAKVTIDSATLMNKGLEAIEARWLFDVPPERIGVVVHAQSVVHSLVTFVDGSTKAQLGAPDMRGPIQYALSFPERWPLPVARPAWADVGRLDFEAPDLQRFPALRLAFEAMAAGGAAGAVLNAANEVAVARFLAGAVGFLDIPRIVERVLGRLGGAEAATLGALEALDAEARRLAEAEPAA